jgi:hypothetical protein
VSDVKIDIPDTLIEDVVQAEIVRQFPDKETFAEQCIAAMLKEKRNSWREKSMFGEACQNMIQEEAKRIFGQWIEENRELLRDTLYKFLSKDKNKVLKKLCEDWTKNLSKWSVELQVTMKDWES